jgi:ATP/maltotriose-dependent transcriptional regulator MalT
MIERHMGNYKDAWLLLEKALACAKQHNANHFITGVKINMANIKSDQGILNEAEVIYKEALLVAKQISDRKKIWH